MLPSLFIDTLKPLLSPVASPVIVLPSCVYAKLPPPIST